MAMFIPWRVLSFLSRFPTFENPQLCTFSGAAQTFFTWAIQGAELATWRRLLIGGQTELTYLIFQCCVRDGFPCDILKVYLKT